MASGSARGSRKTGTARWSGVSGSITAMKRGWRPRALRLSAPVPWRAVQRNGANGWWWCDRLHAERQSVGLEKRLAPCGEKAGGPDARARSRETPDHRRSDRWRRLSLCSRCRGWRGGSRDMATAGRADPPTTSAGVEALRMRASG